MTSFIDFPTPRVPRTALISPDPALRSLVTSCLEECAPGVEWVLRAESDVTELRPESVDRLAEREPELLFIDVGSSPSAGARFISAITTVIPGLTVVPAGGQVGVDDLLKLVRAGASGYLPRPWSKDEVIEVCTNLLRKMPPPHSDFSEAESSVVSHVIALFSPKGGTGVSTLAANLTVHIRNATAKNTLLLDLSPELGTSPVLLGAEPRYSYLDIVDSLQRMDERLLYSFLEEHESGAWVLASPGGASMSRELAQDQVHALLRLLRRHFEYIVVDAGRAVIDEAALTALELADERLLVTTAELPTLRNTKQVLPYIPHRLAADDSAEEHVRLVVNRFQDSVSVPTKDIERAVGLTPFQVLEEDADRVGRSVNLGQPVVLNRSSSYARGVRKLGDTLAAADLTTKGRGSGLSGLLKTLMPSRGSSNGDAGAARARPRGPTDSQPSTRETQRPKLSVERSQTEDHSRADRSTPPTGTFTQGVQAR